MRPIKEDDDVQSENFTKAKDFMIEQIKVYIEKISKNDDSDDDAPFNPLNQLEVFIKDRYLVDEDQGSIGRATWWYLVLKKFRINFLSLFEDP